MCNLFGFTTSILLFCTIVFGHETGIRHTHRVNLQNPRWNLTWTDFNRFGNLNDSGRLRIRQTMLNNKRDTPEVSTCPICPVVSKTPSPCAPTVQYDRNFQAATLEEAMLNFPDLTSPEGHKSIHSGSGSINEKASVTYVRQTATTPMDARKSNTGSFAKFGGPGGNIPSACTPQDQICQSCSCALIRKLSSNRLLSKNGITDSSQMEQRLGLNCSAVAFVPCRKFRFSNPSIRKRTNLDLEIAPELLKFSNTNVKKVSNRMRSLQFDRLRGGRMDDGLITAAASAPTAFAAPVNEMLRDIDGETTFPISCVKRGDPETESPESWVVICDMCWSWRVLPEEYFPRYINELRCSGSEGAEERKCLNKLGACQQREKTMTVQKNVGTFDQPDWQPVDLSSSSCCDCKVLKGSPMHGFVAK